MFGLGDQNQQSNDDPAMLDNVKQLASEPADQMTAHTSAPPPSSEPGQLPTINDVSPPSAAQSTDNNPATEPPHLQGFTMDPPTPQQTGQDLTPPAATDDNDAAYDDQSDTESREQTAADNFSSEDMIPGGPPYIGSVSGQASSTQPPDDDLSTDSLETPTAADSSEAPDHNQSRASGDRTDSELPAADPEHLANLKQQALEHLEPLTEHIDGSPEERFKTTMMMIQANDNHTLLEKALKAAKQIEDDKVRAQAMLDIINEINYFAQNSEPK